jgi:hypothetical protein
MTSTEHIFCLHLSMVAVTGALSHTKPASTGSFSPYFPCSLIHLISCNSLKLLASSLADLAPAENIL